MKQRDVRKKNNVDQEEVSDDRELGGWLHLNRDGVDLRQSPGEVEVRLREETHGSGMGLPTFMQPWGTYGGFENPRSGFTGDLGIKPNPSFSSGQRIWLVKLKTKSLETNKGLQPLLYLELHAT